MSLLEKKKTHRGMLPSFRSTFDELFDFDGFFDEPRMRMPRMANLPAANIRELDEEYLVELAVPGLNKEDFHVEVDDHTLEIKVEKESESSEEKEKYTRKEYDYTAFYRSFTLPEEVKADSIKAEYNDGVLRIHLPKTEVARKRPLKEISVD